MLGAFLILMLLFTLVGALPTWEHSRGWGYSPAGGLGLVIVVMTTLLLLGRL